jgi:acyl-CoA thioester hydrolase
VGFPLNRLLETGGAFVARRHEIDYLAPILLGDRLAVRTRVTGMGGARSIREVGIFRDETEVARARTEWVFVDLQTTRPRRVPREILVAFGL